MIARSTKQRLAKQKHCIYYYTFSSNVAFNKQQFSSCTTIFRRWHFRVKYLYQGSHDNIKMVIKSPQTWCMYGTFQPKQLFTKELCYCFIIITIVQFFQQILIYVPLGKPLNIKTFTLGVYNIPRTWYNYWYSVMHKTQLRSHKVDLFLICMLFKISHKNKLHTTATFALGQPPWIMDTLLDWDI